MATVETIKTNIQRNKDKITELQKKVRQLEAQLIEAENLEIFKVMKAVNMTNREVTELLKAYASGQVVLPEDIREELMEDEDDE